MEQKYQAETGNDLHLYYSGSERCAPGHSFGPAVRTHYLIHFIRSGRGSYVRAGVTYHLKEGDAFLIIPGETTRYTADRDDPWDYTWMAFNGAGAQTLLENCGFSRENVIFHAKNDCQKEKLIRQTELFEEHFLNDRQNFLEIMGHFYLLLACMYVDGAKREQATLTGQKLYFRQAAEYLQHNFIYPVKVEQLARYVGVSRSYLYKAFIACSGKSIQQYLISLRLQEACSLLAETERGITDIAYSCGFTDSPSFCRHFRQAYGQTPLEFRQKMSGN